MVHVGRFLIELGAGFAYDEMKRLMKEVVNKVFAVLMHRNDEESMSALFHCAERQAVRWNEPEPLAAFVLPE